MKKITFILSLLFAAGFAAYAQTDACESGFCPETITAHHYKGVDGMSVAPQNGNRTYKVIQTTVGGSTQCWIAQNLGAYKAAGNANDNDPSARGWFWQFNKKQGYLSDGGRFPNTTWITSITENSDWLSENDPCTILLGEHWRLPTRTELNAIDTWTDASSMFNSVYKLHNAGYLRTTDGDINGTWGSSGAIWSSQQDVGSNANGSAFSTNAQAVQALNKATGYSVRCLRDFSW